MGIARRLASSAASNRSVANHLNQLRHDLITAFASREQSIFGKPVASTVQLLDDLAEFKDGR